MAKTLATVCEDTWSKYVKLKKDQRVDTNTRNRVIEKYRTTRGRKFKDKIGN